MSYGALSAKQQLCWDLQQGLVKAGRSACLMKIPPLACGLSAPFDKGVNQGLPIPAASTLPGNQRRTDKGVNTGSHAELTAPSSPEFGEEPLTRV
jgi:hypothetical protein